MMVKIEAPDESFRVFVTTKESIVYQVRNSYLEHLIRQGDETSILNEFGLDVAARQLFVDWCSENAIPLPDMQMNDDYTVSLCFASEEEAVYFKLLWQKGCVST